MSDRVETQLEELGVKIEAKIEGMQPLSKAREAILNRPPTDDLINDLLPDSASAYMLICGRSGIGKTFLALNVLFCLATGVPFLSHKTKKCKVGLLSMEGSDRKLLNRFDRIALSFPAEAKDNIFWHHTTAITGAHKLDCTPMIGQIGLGESGGVSRYSPD
jgi:RecA-family ATPase